MAIAIFYIAVPLLDKLLGEDLSNPPESVVPRLEADRYYRLINYAVVPVLWGSLLFNCIFLATHELSWDGLAGHHRHHGLDVGLWPEPEP